jgi:hypothetical protein
MGTTSSWERPHQSPAVQACAVADGGELFTDGERGPEGGQFGNVAEPEAGREDEAPNRQNRGSAC